ncbi:hypothetical protein VT85_17330 [Planctomyces sp. SH-PL62]|nr:hypothetical protein [Planctomyces sp. SH-PL62]AMV39203.1 hypothetical protein VT85_17330 [Planctomyces sp. SH-PL62]
MAEMELSVLARQCLDRCVPEHGALRTEVAAWQARRNASVARVDWWLKAADAWIKLKRLYPTTEMQ